MAKIIQWFIGFNYVKFHECNIRGSKVTKLLLTTLSKDFYEPEDETKRPYLHIVFFDLLNTSYKYSRGWKILRIESTTDQTFQ